MQSLNFDRTSALPLCIIDTNTNGCKVRFIIITENDMTILYAGTF